MRTASNEAVSGEMRREFHGYFSLAVVISSLVVSFISRERYFLP